MPKFKPTIEYTTISEMEEGTIREYLSAFPEYGLLKIAKICGITERTLYNKIKLYNINVDKQRRIKEEV